MATCEPVRSMLAFGLRYKEIRLLVLWTLLAAAAVAVLDAPTRALPHVAVSAAAWFVLEYLIHRFVLHARGRVAAILARFGLDVHWRHHLVPNDPVLVFTPWWASLLLVLGAAAVGSISEGRASAAGAALGMSATSVLYELTHLSAHVPYVHRTPLGRFMKRFHLLHHFHSEHAWFGVTNPFGDWLAGTWPDRAAVERSPTVRTLGVDVDAV